MAEDRGGKGAAGDNGDPLSAQERGRPEPRPRWWQRRPGLGVVMSLGIGLVALWLSRSLGPPSNAQADTFLYMVTLPIALLLPAAALAGAMLAWNAWAASSGSARVLLAIPAAAALCINVTAAGLFLRFLIIVFLR